MCPRPVSNPPNPWQGAHVEWLGEPPPARLEVYEERARSILSKNESPDLPFRYSLNPYRGCTHACAYCYARPSHTTLDLGAGTDFESRVVVKVNAPERLEARLGRPSWRGDLIAFCGNTDPYQPLEASYELTRRCLSVCLRHDTPVGVITKGALVERDLDLLAALARGPGLWIVVSLATLDPKVARVLEPGAASVERRLATLERLAEAGLSPGVALAPVVPGLCEHEVPSLLERAAAAGARHAFLTPLRLPPQVAQVFFERLEAALPGRARRVERALREVRGGHLDERRFGARMRGLGPRWAATEALFRSTCRRLGLATEGRRPPPRARARPHRPRQAELFPTGRT